MKQPPCTNCGKVHNRKRVPCKPADVLKWNGARHLGLVGKMRSDLRDANREAFALIRKAIIEEAAKPPVAKFVQIVLNAKSDAVETLYALDEAGNVWWRDVSAACEDGEPWIKLSGKREKIDPETPTRRKK